MPSKNEEKIYVSNSYYHLYNRGVEKREIFMDDQDYAVFLSYLKNYLMPVELQRIQSELTNPRLNYRERDRLIRQTRLNNFASDLELIAYCLMPNHFHFLFYQTYELTIDDFMNSFLTRYVMYFNKKYVRVGPLFQGNYKAVMIETENQLLHLSRYIHQQAIKSDTAKNQPSSYRNYLGQLSQEWVKPEKVLSYFKSGKRLSPKEMLSYQSFVEGSIADNQTIGGITLE